MSNKEYCIVCGCDLKNTDTEKHLHIVPINCLHALQEQLAEKDAENARLESVLIHIALKCVDYDGYSTVDGLKKLVDTINDIAVTQEALP